MVEGLNEILFHLIWTKDKVFDSVVKVIIPHTVIFQYYQPRFWYFTSTEGIIKRKSKNKLTLQHIKDEFLGKKQLTDKLLAQNSQDEFLIRQKSKEKIIQEESLNKKKSALRIIAMLLYIEGSKRVIEYLNEEQFGLFINERITHKEMILQKFVKPNGAYNNSLSILWTTNFSLFEKKTNKVELYNSEYDIYERAVTFEGKEYHVSTIPLRGTLLAHRLMKSANSIVSHVSAVTFEKMKVLRMLLQYRIGKGDKL